MARPGVRSDQPANQEMSQCLHQQRTTSQGENVHEAMTTAPQASA